MGKYVFTVREDICAQNSKDVNATDLLSVMKHYGTVEVYDQVRASEKAEFQANINSLTAQLDALKDQNLTADEIKLIKAYREQKTSVVSGYIAENDQLKESLRKADEKAKNLSIAIGETLAAYAKD